MGAGMASALAPAVVGNALSDLKGTTSGANILSPKFSRGPHISTPVWVPGSWAGSQSSNHRKRKEAGGMPASEHPGNGMAEAASSCEGSASAAVQIAALQALEALLTSGGALLPDRWRTEVDAVLASVAMAAATGTISASTSFEEDCGYPEALSGEFQVAAYQALLASLLSPCCHRPPFLAQGLSIFRNGRQEAGTQVAAVCAHALLALEPLIHPRCLPPAGTPAAMAAAMATGRATTSSTLLSHLQRPNKPTSGANPLAPRTAVTGVKVGIPSAPPVKVGQLPMDPWAEVDTWLGYGEDFGEDDGLFYSENDSILVEDGGHVGSLTLEKDYSDQNAGLGSSPPYTCVVPSPVDSSPKRDMLQDFIMPSIVRNEREARPVIAPLDDPSAILGVQKDLMQSERDTEMCLDMEEKALTSSGFDVSISTYLPATGDAFSFSHAAAADMGSDSDSDGPLPPIIEGDPEPDSD